MVVGEQIFGIRVVLNQLWSPRGNNIFSSPSYFVVLPCPQSTKYNWESRHWRRATFLFLHSEGEATSILFNPSIVPTCQNATVIDSLTETKCFISSDFRWILRRVEYCKFYASNATKILSGGTSKLSRQLATTWTLFPAFLPA